MSRRVALLLVLALSLAVLPAAAGAQTATRGSTLERTPFVAGQGNDCAAYFALGGPVPNPWGATTCSYYQGFVFGNANDARTGFVPGDGVVTTVTVKVGANPAPLQFVVLRQLTNAQLGAVSGEPKCCFFVRETPPLQPAPNTTTTFTVNLPVESNRQPNVITQDAIGFSAPTGGTLPLAFTPNFSPAVFTPGDVTSSSFHPKLSEANGTGTGGAFASGHQGGLDVLLQYTFTPTAGPVAPTPGPGPGGGPGAAANPVVLRPTDITTIGGSVLRPIGGALDVVLDCLQVTCAGTLNVLSRRPVAAAAKRRVRSLGKRAFSLKQGKGRKVRVKLNRLGRRLAKARRTPVKVVVDFGGQTGSTSRNLTLKPKRRAGRPRG